MVLYQRMINTKIVSMLLPGVILIHGFLVPYPMMVDLLLILYPRKKNTKFSILLAHKFNTNNTNTNTTNTNTNTNNNKFLLLLFHIFYKKNVII